jgi:selenocysteine lyase/cysteine desulfurase
MTDHRLRLSRRTFIGGAVAAPAAGVLAACGSADEDSPARPAESEAIAAADVASWRRVRALFELEPGVQHLTAYILAPHSRPVRAAIARHRRGMDANPHRYEVAHARLEREAAGAAARHLRTDVAQVALTDSTTMGLGLFFGGLRLAQGDEVVMSAHEHFTARHAVRLAVERSGATRTEVELYPPASAEQATVQGIVTAIDNAITDATRAVLITWVHSATGIRMPVREIAEVVARKNRGRAEERRVLLVVDGVHGLGAGPARVNDLGCDVLIAGCHKWLAGPRGTGLVWARPEAWARTAPTIPSWSSWGGEEDGGSPGARMTPGGYHSFEHRWALGPAFALQERIGTERIGARIRELSDRLRSGLRGIRGVTVHVPREPALHSGLVCFTVPGRSAQVTVGRLWQDHRVVASVTPYAVELARLGTSWMNTGAEVDAAVTAVRRIAR